MPIIQTTPNPDPLTLYRTMVRCRVTEESIRTLWDDGLISGEMHLGTGEEAIIAGVMAHTSSADALALDHRPTAAMVAAGVEQRGLIAECLGLPSGICGGCGGHMHLFAPDRPISSSGIVGASGPASAWQLPVLFLCKDDNWAISTVSDQVTGGSINKRASAMGLESEEVDGLDAIAVWKRAKELIRRVRETQRPAFLRATCVHLDGHFLGDPLLAGAAQPVIRGIRTLAPALRGALHGPGRGGAEMAERTRAIGHLARLTVLSRATHSQDRDPLVSLRGLLHPEQAAEIERSEREVINPIVANLRREYAVHWRGEK